MTRRVVVHIHTRTRTSIIIITINWHGHDRSDHTRGRANTKHKKYTGCLSPQTPPRTPYMCVLLCTSCRLVLDGPVPYNNAFRGLHNPFATAAAVIYRAERAQ